MIIILHVLNRERFDGVGRGFPLRRIGFGKQRRPERAAGQIIRALQFAGDGSGQLRLDDFEILFGQRGRKFVVGEQLHAAFKLVGQHLTTKNPCPPIRSRRCRRAPFERPAGPAISCRRRTIGRAPGPRRPCRRHLHLGIVFDPAINADGVADGFRLHDELDAIGQIGDERIQRGGGNFNLFRYLFSPMTAV